MIDMTKKCIVQQHEAKFEWIESSKFHGSYA